MSIVKNNLKVPLVFVMVCLALLFYINVGNIGLLRNISDLIFVAFSFNTLMSVVFGLAKILLISLVILFCLKKLEERSNLITNEDDQQLSGLEDLLRRRYYYAHKTWGYFLYGLGWFGVILSLIGNTFLIFKHSNSIIFTIAITLIITIPLEVFIIKMLNKNLAFVKKIMSCYK